MPCKQRLNDELSSRGRKCLDPGHPDTGNAKCRNGGAHPLAKSPLQAGPPRLGPLRSAALIVRRISVMIALHLLQIALWVACPSINYRSFRLAVRHRKMIGLHSASQSEDRDAK